MYFPNSGIFRVDAAAPAALRDSLLYRLSYHRFGDVKTERGTQPCFVPRTRRSPPAGVQDGRQAGTAYGNRS